MIISPESFYETEVKGKSIEQIQKIIRSLKRTINSLKKGLEHPDGERVVTCPSDETLIACNRDCLRLAIVGLTEAGGTYIPTRAEARANMFQDRIPEIMKVKFVRSAFFRGADIFEVDFKGERCTFHFGFSGVDDESCEIDGAEFLLELEKLYLGEWKSRYVDNNVLDGEQWELTVEYGNPRDTFVVYGSNEYPYNFDRLAELMDMRIQLRK